MTLLTIRGLLAGARKRDGLWLSTVGSLAVPHQAVSR